MLSYIDIIAVQQALAKDDEVSEAKIDLKKESKAAVGSLERWHSYAGVGFGPNIHMQKDWSEVQAKLNVRVRAWLTEICIHPLIL